MKPVKLCVCSEPPQQDQHGAPGSRSATGSSANEPSTVGSRIWAGLSGWDPFPQWFWQAWGRRSKLNQGRMCERWCWPSGVFRRTRFLFLLLWVLINSVFKPDKPAAVIKTSNMPVKQMELVLGLVAAGPTYGIPECHMFYTADHYEGQ